MRWRGARSSVSIAASIPVLLLACGAPGLHGQDSTAGAAEDAGPASGSYAVRGLTIGAISGGLAGGVGLGILAGAFCESSDCDGAFLSGALVGAGLGALTGGTVGLVIGALIPREPPSRRGDPPRGGDRPDPGTAEPGARDARPADTPAGETRPGEGDSSPPSEGSPFRVGISFGPARGSGEPNARTDVSVAVTFLADRPYPTNVGFELTYLGTRSMTFSRPGGDSGPITTTLRDRLWGGSILATRRVLGGPTGGGYLLASAGGYLEESSRTFTGGTAGPTLRDESGLRPGLGAGIGGSWATWDRVGLGFEGRAHVIFGAGDGVLALWSLGGTLWFLR
jgi:hypothetical protein